ncbi:hypothetical protein EMPS_07283 [Entomortierella parvispora]|uniref:Uncharacterized protein n=1 Tax=Entomortierella parvispora TaxID=205924 RepID=A0A9P3HDV3_9FUNG|nr:hypothetical protein EMPS_07283 [Entomortierella parvispora]
MKVLLRLSLAALLVTTSLALSLQEFVDDKQVQILAPHLIQEIDTQGIESFAAPPIDISSAITANIKLPLLNDIIQIVSLNIFHAQDADWSKLENARLKIIQEHGAEALAEASKLTEADTRRAALVLDTIYDAVINLPAASKETLASKKKEDEKKVAPDAANDRSTSTDSKPDSVPEEEKKEETTDKKDDSSPSLLNTAWEYLGLGLIKSSDTVKKAQGIVYPQSVCETTDTAYLKGVDNVVYYSSLTHGLAGGALISAPADSAVKSLDLGSIVTSIGKLAIEVQMAQSVARLADLKLTDPAVRAVTYLALAAENAESPSAQTARDINNLINKGLSDLIPEAVLHSLSDQAALTLVTRGAGKAGGGGGTSVFAGVPVLRNVFAFSSDVLNANSIGDVLKYVFCPDASHATEPPKAKVVEEEVKTTAEEVKEKGKETAQKVLKVPEEVAADTKKATEKEAEDAKAATDNALKDGKKVAEAAQEKGREASEKVREAVDTTSDKVKEAGDRVQDTVTEGAEKVDADAKKAAEDIKVKAAEAKAKTEEDIEAAQKKASEEAQKASEEAKKVADKVQDKVDEAKEEL